LKKAKSFASGFFNSVMKTKSWSIRASDGRLSRARGGMMHNRRWIAAQPLESDTRENNQAPQGRDNVKRSHKIPLR
jgi:hypothetical protein